MIVHVDGEALTIGKFQMRGRFAMRLADYKDEEGAVARLGGVRDAFNSPFRPFVLATTSIGQEGLDFHPYCYRVYHWNLPGNPVDLEQREGRVHRFKGHAVRLNLAERQADVVRGTREGAGRSLEADVRAARDPKRRSTRDLIPYWIYEGSVRVERRVPMLPFSREVTRLAWLKRSLTVYRLAFGQPRQDDLLEYLQTLAGAGIDPASSTICKSGSNQDFLAGQNHSHIATILEVPLYEMKRVPHRQLMVRSHPLRGAARWAGLSAKRKPRQPGLPPSGFHPWRRHSQRVRVRTGLAVTG